jgi:hypothetical protein
LLLPPLPPLDPLLAALPLELELELLDGSCAFEVDPPLPDESELAHAAPNPAIKRVVNAKCGRAVI